MKGKVAMAVRVYGQLASHTRRVDELTEELNSIVASLSDEELSDYVYHSTKIQDKEDAKLEAFVKRVEAIKRVEGRKRMSKVRK